MKNILKNILLVLVGFMIIGTAQAQDRRTLETKVADILAQFPAKEQTYADKLVQNIADLGETGIVQFCDMIIPPGTGDDTQARFAIESLAIYAGAPGHEALAKSVESALLKAIQKASDKEVKAFFIRRLTFCGSNASVKTLADLLSDDKLYSPAAAVLTSIGTKDAAEALFGALDGASEKAQITFVKDLGVLKCKKAVPAITALVGKNDVITKQALYALANIGTEEVVATISDAAKAVAYKTDPTEAMPAYLHLVARLAENGQKATSEKLCKNLLKKCKAEDQLHFRSGALKVLRENTGAALTSTLLKEIKNEDKAYRNAVLIYAADGMTSAEVSQWVAVAKKAEPETKAQIIGALAKRTEAEVLDACILPALNDESLLVRTEVIAALALNQKEKAISVLLEKMETATDSEEIAALKKALLQAVSVKECGQIAEKLGGNNTKTLVEILGERRATDYFADVKSLCTSDKKGISKAAFDALQNVATPANTSDLLQLMVSASGKNIEAVQKAIVAAIKLSGEKEAGLVLAKMKDANLKQKLVPVLPFIDDPKAFETVTGIIENGTEKDKAAAFEALLNWKNKEALPYLFKVIEKNEFASERARTFGKYLGQVMNSDFPADQKLLLVRKLMPVAKGQKEQAQLINTAGSIKTFLSLVFVAEYLDDPALANHAAKAAMKVMLPTPGEEDGLKGEFVKNIAEKVIETISGPDSQYFKIDLREFVENMPAGIGFEQIFNGKDLKGWQGLVENPIKRSKMSAKELAEKQIEANKKMHENWSVKDNSIVFNGKGANLCTKKMYGDFEMIVDWRITKDGDSGIYLRGSPQVQIWDIARVDVGAQVGSGGLYNNWINPRKPPVVADNPVGEWNTFRIKMVGERVDVYLNGIKVVDNVILENYWDRSIPIFPKEAIELQAHGTDLAFRNIFVREINAEETKLCEKESAEGFQLLFNGKNLDGWVGNKTDYVVEDGVIAVRPKNGGHGNLFTEKEYSNFVFRFEFKLTPGANNGLGIHAPLKGDAAYVGKELQILDNTAPIYANLKEYQYHGSVYGTIAAKRGFLKPVGEWNVEEVIVKGDDFKITLNGEVILEGNVKEASKNGTADGKDHPGLKRHTGHIGFLGHGSELWFRNIRIKEL